MVPTPLFYQLLVVALVLICLLIHVGLPDMPLPKPQPPLASNKRRRRRSQEGFVANFAQKVMKGQLPLSVRRLRGERVELFGRSEALFPSLNHHLFFPDHVHEFDPN